PTGSKAKGRPPRRPFCLLHVLLVVPLAVDLLALAVLRLLDAGALLLGHLAVGGGALFHLLHPRLAFLQPRRLLLGELTLLLSLLDAPLLVGLALVDARGTLGLRQGTERDAGEDESRRHV